LEEAISLSQEGESQHVPTIDMQFKTDDEAYKFYNQYALIVGFSVVKCGNYHSRDKETLGMVTRMTFKCNKRGKSLEEYPEGEKENLSGVSKLTNKRKKYPDITDGQRSLVHLDDQRLNSHWQQKALTKLLGLQYKIFYKKGSSKNAADALSKVSHDPSSPELLAISMAQPTWLEVLQTSYIDNAEAKQLLSKLLLHPEQGIFSLVQGVIKYKGRKLGHNALL
jgi:hypothetical protein